MVDEIIHGSLRIFFTTQLTGVRCEGDIDISTRPVLVRALDMVMEQSSEDLHADLGGVSFIDVGGLRVLVEMTSRLTGGRRLVIDDLKPHTWRMIELCGWANVLVTGPDCTPPDQRAVDFSLDVP